MSVIIKLNSIRHSQRKLSPVARLFVGKKLVDAIKTTKLVSNQSSKLINKALETALAVAKQKEFTPESLYIKEIFATPGRSIKRIRANARGRTNRYQKHLAHLVVKVDELKEVKREAAKENVKL